MRIPAFCVSAFCHFNYSQKSWCNRPTWCYNFVHLISFGGVSNSYHSLPSSAVQFLHLLLLNAIYPLAPIPFAHRWLLSNDGDIKTNSMKDKLLELLRKLYTAVVNHLKKRLTNGCMNEWRSDRNKATVDIILRRRCHHNVVFDSHIGAIMWKQWRHRQNRKYITYCIVVREGQSYGHIFRELLTCDNWAMRWEIDTDALPRWSKFAIVRKAYRHFGTGVTVVCPNSSLIDPRRRVGLWRSCTKTPSVPFTEQKSPSSIGT